MNKRLFSMFLALCMIVTMLPVSAMAEEIHTTIGGSGEIISFAPLTETKKAVSLGTSIEDLELPETLTATVRTAVPVGEDAVQDSGSPETATPTTAAEPEWEESTVDIQVKWEPTPEYDPDTEGEYVFTPVITGYTVSAEPPQITVTVEGAIMARGAATPMSATTYDIWVGGVQVTDDNKDDVLGATDGNGATVTYDPDTATLTLDGATINTVYEQTKTETEVLQYGIYAGITNLKMVVTGDNTINCPDATTKISYGIYTTGKLEISGTGSLSANSGTGSVSYGIYSIGELTIKSGIITGISDAAYTSLGICSGKIKISGGNVTANSTGESATAMVANSYEITGGKITATGKNGLSANLVTNSINISGGEVNATGTANNAIRGVLNFDGGMVIAKGEKALVGTLNLISGIATADTSKDGNNAVSYDANNHASYKYLKVEPAPASPAPTVTAVNISISGASGTGGVYRIGDTVTAVWDNTAATGDNNNGVTGVTVNFSEFGGSSAVSATNNAGTWTATYTIITGSIELTSRNVSVTATSAGGTTTTAGTTNVTVDNKNPSVSSVSVPGNATYVAGQGLEFTVNFSEAVEVTTVGGTPYLPLTVGSQTKQATYVSGNGTITLTFRYTVQAGDSDSDGVSIGSLLLNGGTIQDAAGNNANLTLNGVNSTAGIRVNPLVAPSITGHPSSQTVNQGQSATFSVTATGTGLTYQWQVDTGAGFTNITNGGVYSGANTSTLTITGAAAGMNGYQYHAVVSGTVAPAATSESVSLTVNATPTYTITANPTSKDFGSLEVGYSAPTAQTVTITNTGNSSVTLTQPTSTNYTIGTLSTTTLAAGSTATFTFTPKTGLAVGNYTETLNVSTNHSTNATVGLSVSVTAAPTYTLSLTLIILKS